MTATWPMELPPSDVTAGHGLLRWRASLPMLRIWTLKKAFFTGVGLTFFGYMCLIGILQSPPDGEFSYRSPHDYHGYTGPSFTQITKDTDVSLPRPVIKMAADVGFEPRERSGGLKVRKILFLGYSRGGSSISSEIFDVDPRAIYFYESLEAFYFANTGYYGRKNQRVLLYANESDFRPLETWEFSEMSSFFNDMLNCNFRNLPIEFVGHRNTRHTSALDDIRYCYTDNMAPGMKFNVDLRRCREILKDVCGQSVETAIKNGCHDVMQAIHSLDKFTNSLDDATMVRSMDGFLHDKGYTKQFIIKKMPAMLEYRRCIGKMQSVMRKCVTLAENRCQRRRLRTVKIVRYTMPVIKYMLREIPDLFVILFVRDPRAIAYSRANPKELAYSRSDRDRLEAETFRNFVYVCNKFRLDLATFGIRNSHRVIFPDSLKVIRYEDFVGAPYREAETMYAHFGETAPANQLTKFINEHMFATKSDGRIWGNVRTNATENASKWRTEISRRLVLEMERYCGDVIFALGYQFYETKEPS